MKGKVLLGLVMLVSMFFLFMPLAHAELVYSHVNDLDKTLSPLDSFLRAIGLFSVTGYDPQSSVDTYCRATYECTKDSSTGLYRYNCYSGLSTSTACVCDGHTSDTSKCAINQPTTTTTGTCNSPSSTGDRYCSGSTLNVWNVVNCKYDSVICSGGCSAGQCITSTTIACTNSLGCPAGNNCVSGVCQPSGLTQLLTGTGSVCTSGQQQCSGSVAQICYAGQWTTATDCGKTGSSCLSYQGRTSCVNFNTGAIATTCSASQPCTDPTKACKTDSGTCVDFLTNPLLWVTNPANAPSTSVKCTNSLGCPAGNNCVSGVCQPSGLTKLLDQLGLPGGTPPTEKKRDITAEEIAALNADSLLTLQREQVLSETECTTDSSCAKNKCTTFSGAGINTGIIQKYTLGTLIGVCYSGNLAPQPPMPQPTPQTETSAAYTLQEWLSSTAAQRMGSLCKTDKQCDKYEDLQGTGKDYSVRCVASSRIQSKLQEDVTNICNDRTLQKTLSQNPGSTFIVGGSIGAVGGCWAGATAAAGIVIPTALASGGLTVLPGELLGCVLGAAAGSAAAAATTHLLVNSLVIDCQNQKLPSDAGACIATPKGGIPGLDQLAESYTIFGAELPLWMIILLGFIILFIVLSAIGGGKK